MRLKISNIIGGLIVSGFAVISGCSAPTPNAVTQPTPPVAPRKPAHTSQKAKAAPVAQQKPPSAWQKAHAAIASDDTKSATKYALQMLKENTHRKAWFYGNVVHEANQILGIAALREGRIADARRYLIAAGRTPGSPQLNSIGPHMDLAQMLLDKGEKKAVIQYLNLVARFWAYTPPKVLAQYDKQIPGHSATVKRSNNNHQKRLDDWKKQIRAGKKPRLNCN